MNPSPKSKEILTGSPEKYIIIKNIEEFEKKLGRKVPDSIKTTFEEIRTTEVEINKFKKELETINWEKTLTDKLNVFIEQNKASIIDNSKEKLAQVAKNIEQSSLVERAKELAHSETLKEAEKSITESLGEASESIEQMAKNIGGEELGNKTKELTKEGIKKIKEVATVSSFIISLEATKEKGGLMGMMASFLLFVLGFFGFKKEKIKEKVKEALNSKETKKTKNAIGKILTNKFPNKKDYITQTINNPEIFTNDKIKEFYDKLKNGEHITLSELSPNFKNLEINKLLTEETEKYKKDFYAKIIKDIELKYNKTFDKGDKDKIKKLITTHLKINASTIEQLEKRIIKDKQLQVKDIMPILGELGSSTFGFMIGLVSENIISISDLGMLALDNSLNVIKLSLSTLGLTETINIEDLYKNIEGLNDTQKSVLVGLLYRKGGFFLNIIGYVTAGISKIALETILPTNSGVDGIKLTMNALLKGPEKQIENFAKIEKALNSTKEFSNGTEILKESVRNLKQVKNNFSVLKILEESNGNLDTFYKKIEEFNSKNGNVLKINKLKSFSELRTHIATNMESSFLTKLDGSVRNLNNKYIGFGLESSIEEFNKNLSNISKSQSRIALGKVNINVFKKLTDSIDIGKVSKLGDKLLFELRSPDDAKAFIKQLNELAKKTPGLLKGIFNKMPIIAVAGISANSEEGFYKSISEEIKYLIPFLGPFMIIKNEGVDYNTFPPKILKPEETAIAGALFALDGFFFIREKGLVNKGKYLIKPVTDIYDIAKGTAETGQRLYKTVRTTKGASSITAKSGKILLESISKAKNIKGPALVKIAGLIGFLGIAASETLMADDNAEEIINNVIKDDDKDAEKQ